MFLKLFTILGALSLPFGIMVMPALGDGGPADDAESCTEVGGEFSQSDPAILPGDFEGHRRVESTNTCVVTSNRIDRQQSGDEYFAVDFEIQTITSYVTTMTANEYWVPVGTAPGPEISAWACFRNDAKQVGDHWINGDDESPLDGAPTDGDCAIAVAGFPGTYEASSDDRYAVEAIQVEGPWVEVRGWERLNEPTVERAPGEVSSSSSVLGCRDVRTGGYVTEITPSCQMVIDSYVP